MCVCVCACVTCPDALITRKCDVTASLCPLQQSCNRASAATELQQNVCLGSISPDGVISLYTECNVTFQCIAIAARATHSKLSPPSANAASESSKQQHSAARAACKSAHSSAPLLLLSNVESAHSSVPCESAHSSAPLLLLSDVQYAVCST